MGYNWDTSSNHPDKVHEMIPWALDDIHICNEIQLCPLMGHKASVFSSM